MNGPDNQRTEAATGGGMSRWPLRGLALEVSRRDDVEPIKRLIEQVLPAHGCNFLLLQVGYGSEFRSHPEVAQPEALSRRDLADIAGLCRANGIRVVPEINVMGHQSWKGNIGALLRAHPEFDETPDLAEVPYCRSLCPRHPRAKGIVLDLCDEVIDALGADAIHVGLDEVFEIGHCPRCRGTPAAQLFAEWTCGLREHFTGSRGLEMLMWADRLQVADDLDKGGYEGSRNGTQSAVEMIPNDVILCDWHYNARTDYPSIALFSRRGFRVVICPWKKIDATKALLSAAATDQSWDLLGVLQTSWCSVAALVSSMLEEPKGPEQRSEVKTEAETIPAMAAESFLWAMRFACERV